MVSAWASVYLGVLAQTEMASHSNKITAISALLKMFEMPGCLVTIDAIGCQKSIAQLLTVRRADFVLALKKNQSQLHGDVKVMCKAERERKFVHLPHDFY